MLWCALLAIFALCTSATSNDPRFAPAFPPTPGAVFFDGMQLMVDGSPFYIKGICYSPVPVGESPMHEPFGDYFTADYAYIWKRDLPLIKSMGVNTIRIYGWDTTHNTSHVDFLDEVHREGLKVFLTYYVGTKYEDPPVFINTVEAREKMYTNWTREMNLYGDHPAILMWSFGNELNGPWNGFFDQINEEHSCGWSSSYNGNCWNTDQMDDACKQQNECLYTNFFGFINEAAVRAKEGTTRPIVSGMADVDRITDRNKNMVVSKLQLYSHVAPDVGAWGFQLYRGKTFGNYFKYFKENTNSTGKPLIVTEYGNDAYNDPCGWPENKNYPVVCNNLVGQPDIEGMYRGGGVDRNPDGSFHGCADKSLDCALPGGEAQSLWNLALTEELLNNKVNTVAPADTSPPTVPPTCTGPWDGYPECAAKMQWMTDNWMNNPHYAEEGIDGTPCSIQEYFYSGPEGVYCPSPYGDDGSGGVVVGGFIMAWMDEFWKGNVITEGHCNNPCPTDDLDSCDINRDYKPNGKAGGGECSWKAHYDCPNKDTYYHGLCGYRLEGAPDFYINEEWFGHTMPEACGHFVPNDVPDKNPQHFGLDTIAVRPVMKDMQEVWNPEEFARGASFQPKTCAQLLPCWQCIRDHADDDTITPAFRGACATECWSEVRPPSASAPTSTNKPTPVPPTKEPTPLPTAPTPNGQTDNPTTNKPTPVLPTKEPTPLPTAPTPKGQTNNPTITAVPADNTDIRVTLRVSDSTKFDNFEREFKSDLASEWEIVEDRIEIIGLRDATPAPKKLIDFVFRGGAPPAQYYYDQLVAEVGLMAKDPDYGCKDTPTVKCVAHDSGLKLHRATAFIDPTFAPLRDADPVPAKGAGPSIATIVVVSFLVCAVLVVGFLLFRRYQARQKYARNRLLSYQESTEGDYIAPGDPMSNSSVPSAGSHLQVQN